MNTYDVCKKVIENRKSKGTLDKEVMADDLTILLLNNRITGPQYNELMELMKEDATDVNT